MTSGLVQVLGILQDALDFLTDEVSGCAVSPAPCRVSLVPGTDVAWDTFGTSCSGGDGQLWANINTLTASTQRGECKTVTWSGTVGIIRCASGLKDSGAPPSTDELDADAWAQARDADQIWRALTCCEGRPETLRDLEVVTWIALGPAGYAAGGAWTVRGSVDVCC